MQMSWLNCIVALSLVVKSRSSDYKIYWSESFVHGQEVNVLYGSAVEFRCHNHTVQNLYEVSKEEYDNCEPRNLQRSLLNCTQDMDRGRDIFTILMVQHDITDNNDPFFKDYIPGNLYYFISTASTRGSDQEKLSNMAGGNCRYRDIKITLKVVNQFVEEVPANTESIDTSSSSDPDPGGAAVPSSDEKELSNETEKGTPTATTTFDQRHNEGEVNGLESSGPRRASSSFLLLVMSCSWLWFALCS